MVMGRACTVFAVVALLLVGCRNKGGPPTPTPSESEASTVVAQPPSPVASAAVEPSVSSGTILRIITYNILASPVFIALRRDAIVALLDELDADIVALQEVPSWMVEALTNPASKLARYRHTERDGAPFVPGGQLILSRHPIGETKAAVLPGRQRRTVLIATVEVAGHPITVATSHMESFLEDGPIRAAQLDVIFGMLSAAEHAIFLGDFNFGDGEEPDTAHLDPSYVDLWQATRPDDPGFTWNNDQNPMAGLGAFAGEPNRRLDRVLVRSPRLKPKSIRIIGDEPAGERVLAARERMMIQPAERVPKGHDEPTIAVFPSDHYGLVAELAIAAP